MIEKVGAGDIFNTTAKHIAFTINTEGVIGCGFDGQVTSKGWHELVNCGENPIGTVFTKTIDGKTYHALVMYSLKKGWGSPAEQWENARKCFNKIPVKNEEEIASVAIGTGFIGSLTGASPKHIVCGMVDSKQNIVVYGFSLEAIKYAYEEETKKRICEQSTETQPE